MLVGKFWSFCKHGAHDKLSDRNPSVTCGLYDCIMFGWRDPTMNNFFSLFHASPQYEFCNTIQDTR